MTQIKNEPIPVRPSNQSGVKTEQHGNMWYAVGGGVCTINSSESHAVKEWHDIRERRAKLGLKYKEQK